MTPATKEPDAEVYYPDWLDRMLAHQADAVAAVQGQLKGAGAFADVVDQPEATTSTREVWGAANVLKDVHDRLTAIREDPAAVLDGTGDWAGELWDASYRLSVAAGALRQHTRSLEDDSIVRTIQALADGLVNLGTVTDERQARERKGGES